MQQDEIFVWYVNDTRFEISRSQILSLIYSAIPPYMQSSTAEAPDPVSDVIRGAIKSAAVMPTGFGKPNLLNVILFQTYGKLAPIIPKRADKLPYIWRCMADWIANQLRYRRIEITATPTEGENTYRVIDCAAVAIQPTPTGSDYEQARTGTAIGTTT